MPIIMDPVKDKVDDDGQKDDHHTKRGVHMVEWIENRVRCLTTLFSLSLSLSLSLS